MKVLKARVNWMLGWANRPHLEILVDKIPEMTEMRFEERYGLYYAEKDGYVMFFAWSGRGNDGGYDGRIFNIVMADGTSTTLEGPWSSRAGSANAHGFGPCVDVSLTADPSSFERGYTFFSGHITLALAQIAMDLAVGLGTHLIRREEPYGDIRYEPEGKAEVEANWLKEVVAHCPAGHDLTRSDVGPFVPSTYWRCKEHPECEVK